MARRRYQAVINGVLLQLTKGENKAQDGSQESERGN